MSHLMQLFEAARFPGGVEVHTDAISATMTLDGPEHGSLRLFPLAPGVILSFNRIYTLAPGPDGGGQYPAAEFLPQWPVRGGP